MHQPVEEQSHDRLMIIKMANGETVIGQVEKETQGYIELKLPFKLVTFINQKGNINLTIIRWDITIDFDYPVRVFKSSIVACGKPNEQMVANYKELIEGGFDTNIEENEESSTEKDLETIEEKILQLMTQSKDQKLH